MTPHELLRHIDHGDLWPAGAGTGFDALPDAYQTALAVRALRLARGERPRGYKVGFTNRTIWARYGVYAPIWGSVWNTTLSACDGAGALSLSHLCQPRIEPEAVFGLRATPPRDADLQGLFDAIEWIAPGFEIVQSHRPDWRFTAAQSVADSGLHGRLLIGPRVPVAEMADDAAATRSAPRRGHCRPAPQWSAGGRRPRRERARQSAARTAALSGRAARLPWRDRPASR